MKAKDLINLLSDFPPDTPVRIAWETEQFRGFEYISVNQLESIKRVYDFDDCIFLTADCFLSCDPIWRLI